MLERLLEIQVIDMEIADLEDKAAIIPKTIAALDSTVAGEKRDLAECKSRKMNLEKDRDNVDLDIGAKTELLQKWDVQLFAIRTNKEYQAMLVEIGSVKTDISLLEDKLLELMEQVEAVTIEVGTHEDALAAGIARKDEQENTLGVELENIRAQIAALDEKREPIVADVDEGLYAMYERIRKAKRRGPSVVPVLDTTCAGCHMQVPAQVINEIIGDAVHACRNCSRIMYYPDNYPSAAVTMPVPDAGEV